VTKQQSAAAAAARAATGLGRRKRAELLTLMRPAFIRTEAWLQAACYTAAVMGDLPRRNGWTIAKLIGDKTPDRTQRLLSRASWDEAAAMGAVRRFAVAGLDETGQENHGQATAGVQRQHMGCAGGVENGINTVHLSYVREGTGHALIGARRWIPADQIAAPVRSLLMALPLDLQFATKGSWPRRSSGMRARTACASTSHAGTRCTVPAPSCGTTWKNRARPTCCGFPPASASHSPATSG
jgi:hypothetical protein